MSSHQGQSAASRSKMVRFASALATGMRIFSRSERRRFPYWHADTNSGCGINREVRDGTGRPLDGSPIYALRLARETGLCDFRGMFCYRERAAVGELSRRIGSAGAVFFGDNEEFLRVFMELVIREERKPEYATGSVLVDPNGWFYRSKDGKGPPIDSLTALCRALPCIDVILNLNVRSYRMQRAHSWGARTLSVPGIMETLDRKFWLISEIEDSGACDFVVMVGRNVETGDHRRIGMHRAGSAKGQAIIARINGETSTAGEQMRLAI